MDRPSQGFHRPHTKFWQELQGKLGVYLSKGIHLVDTILNPISVNNRVPEAGQFINKRGLFGLIHMKSKNMASTHAWLLVCCDTSVGKKKGKWACVEGVCMERQPLLSVRFGRYFIPSQPFTGWSLLSLKCSPLPTNCYSGNQISTWVLVEINQIKTL